MELEGFGLSTHRETVTGNHFISRMLTPAMRLWLNTQIDDAQELALSIKSSDRQILQGHIPSVHIAATQVVYRGLRLSSIDVAAHNIYTNGLQVLRGHPFQLLESVSINVTLMLTEEDLNQSLQTPLLHNAVEDLIHRILIECTDLHDLDQTNSGFGEGDGSLMSRGFDDLQISQTHISLQQDTVAISGQLSSPSMRGDRPRMFRLTMGLVLANGYTLAFHSPCLEMDGIQVQGRSLERLEKFSINLGETTDLSTLNIGERHLTCQGRILVVP